MEVQVSYHIISHSCGIITVALCVNNKIAHILAGKDAVIQQKLKKLFD
ncbi:hypothetical protein [Priestia koreensis]|nr:hypothetical protein [Priestia koreensis]